MRKFMRRVLDTRDGLDIDSKQLTPYQQLMFGITFAWENSSMRKKSKMVAEEKRELAKLKARDNLKCDILQHIQTILIDNDTSILKDNNEIAQSIILKIERSDAEDLKLVLQSQDFFNYEIEEIKPNPDMLLSFPNLPILLKISKKVIK